MLTQSEYRKLKTRLTRAINSGDPYKIIATVTAAREQFESEGFPDFWPRWRVAVSDLTFSRDDEVRRLARTEDAHWF